MINKIKQVILKLLDRLLNKKNFKIVPFYQYEGQLEIVKYDWIKELNIETIIDVGASYGQYSTKARSLFTNSTIFAFEPLPESFEKLKNSFSKDSKFFPFRIAMSNFVGEVNFFKNQHVGSSSLLEMTNLHKVAHPYSKNSDKIIVKSDTLDNFFKNRKLENNILLKLDVQGAESNVLEGAADLLKKVRLIYIEISFNKLYENQMLITEIIYYLKDFGFRFVGIEDISQSLKDGIFLQGNAFFNKDE